MGITFVIVGETNRKAEVEQLKHSLSVKSDIRGLQISEAYLLGMKICQRIYDGMANFHLVLCGPFDAHALLLPPFHAVLQGLLQPIDEDKVSIIQLECVREAPRGTSVQLDNVAVVEIGQDGCFVDELSIHKWNEQRVRYE